MPHSDKAEVYCDEEKKKLKMTITREVLHSELSAGSCFLPLKEMLSLYKEKRGVNKGIN